MNHDNIVALIAAENAMNAEVLQVIQAHVPYKVWSKYYYYCFPVGNEQEF